jgi:O-acetyl-ADP-ribose deacetylase (regulator of RNase III)
VKEIVKLKGDILSLAENGCLDVVVHGCNCFCTMGAGIARQIAQKYPEIKKIDSKTVYGDIRKLTHHTMGVVGNDYKFKIINAYTQYRPGRVVDEFVLYSNIEKAVRNIFALGPEELLRGLPREKNHIVRIGFPRIGAGIAGGDCNIISSIIKKEYKACMYRDCYELYLIEFSN